MSQKILIVVHPGSLCGSADMNLGRAAAKRVRDEIIGELRDWRDALVVLDGELSDELFGYRPLFTALKDAIATADEMDFGRRLEADDPGHSVIARDFLIRSGVEKDAAIVLTGAWHHPDEHDESGCINSTQNVLIEAGFSNVTISPAAAKLSKDSEYDDTIDEPPTTRTRRPRPY